MLPMLKRKFCRSHYRKSTCKCVRRSGQHILYLKLCSLYTCTYQPSDSLYVYKHVVERLRIKPQQYNNIVNVHVEGCKSRIYCRGEVVFISLRVKMLYVTDHTCHTLTYIITIHHSHGHQ